MLIFKIRSYSARSDLKIRIARFSGSGKKKEPKPKRFGPDIFGWGGGLPREGVGAEKCGMSLETREIKLFGRDIPGFCRDIPEVPEKFETKNFKFNVGPHINIIFFWGGGGCVLFCPTSPSVTNSCVFVL